MISSFDQNLIPSMESIFNCLREILLTKLICKSVYRPNLSSDIIRAFIKLKTHRKKCK